MSSMDLPYYPQAVLLPIFAFPSWILCIPPLFWHFRQSNVAAGSLILWVIFINFFNSINPLIWPRDNLPEWWDGQGWCDINVRIQVGATVGTTASAAMIVRKLAKVMDTRNIKVSSSRNSKLKEKALEIMWCWVYPLVFIIVYYVVQPARYFIYGITGCVSTFDPSWPSIVLNTMWAPITTIVAACYAVLLTYRLYRYRREFVRLVAARNTTKSRFIRLFVICIIIIAAYVPYTLWLVVVLCRSITEPYSWSRVHNPATFHAILKVPSFGTVSVDKWGQVATGYVLFFVFGTGSDAYNTYKKMLLAVGLGHIFPGLHVMRETGPSTPSSFINARTWTSGLSSKAKSMFWSRSDSVADTFGGESTRCNSVALGSMMRLGSVTAEDPMLHRDATQHLGLGLFNRVFGRNEVQRPVLPIFLGRRSRSEAEMTETDMHKRDLSPRASAAAWASDKSSSRKAGEGEGVRVFQEIRLDHEQLEGGAKERNLEEDWA